jgi:DNA-binding MarR family transcriptional regulator
METLEQAWRGRLSLAGNPPDGMSRNRCRRDQASYRPWRRSVPAHAGIFRILSATPGLSQQALATALGTVPSRLVALMDELESQGLVERRAHETDRRTHALHLTDKGRATLQSISRIAHEHRQDLLAALSDEEQGQLAGFLQRVAEQQGLIKGVHPGFAKPGRTEKKPEE